MSSKIPGYQVIKKVGDGGMSTVYLAIQLSVGREVALKILSPELRSDPSFAERFNREASIVGALSHPNVISIYDVGQHKENYYMAMDYLPGLSCKDKIKSDQLTPEESLKILKEVTTGIEYVHGKGYLHCDIKPDNILFRANGTAVITDFGIAREIKDKHEGAVSGTPYYMSPEQAQGHKLNKSSDIYSMGVLLFEMLTGRIPYQGKDPIAVAIKHVSAPIPELPDNLKTLSPLINKMMAKRPGARFQNGNEVTDAIDYIESLYLKQKNTKIPLKLQITFTFEKIKEKIKNYLGMSKHLQYSFKHGLILNLVNEDFLVPDVQAIIKTMERTLAANGTITGLEKKTISKDSIGMALETEQAKRVVSPYLLNPFILFLLLGIAYVFSSDSITNMMNNTGKPKITYFD